MSKATNQNTRRDILVNAAAISASALVAMPTVANATSTDNDDVEILRLWKTLDAIWQHEDEIVEAIERCPIGSPEEATLARQIDTTLEGSAEIVDQLLPLRAGCRETLIIKAKAIAWCYHGQNEPVILDDASETTDCPDGAVDP